MRLKIGNFEIKVKARDVTAPHLKTNKDDTRLFLNWLSIKLHDASRYERKNGKKFTAEETKRWANDITEALQKVGYWKKDNNDDVGK